MILKRILLFLVLSLLLCETSFLYEKYEALRNIGNKFELLIEDFARDDAEKISLTKERLRTVAELRLRKEGMLIVKEGLEIPMIHVKATVVGLAYEVSLTIYEWAVLTRFITPFKWTIVATWWGSIVGNHGGDSDEIISRLNELFDTFFNDYYKANPKEKKEARSWT